MKQREFSLLLRCITVLLLICCLFLAAYVAPQYGQRIVERSPALEYLYWPSLIFFWVTMVPVLVSLWFAWCIFTQIGKNNSFSYENAYHLRNISLLAAADSIFYVIAAVVLAFLKVLHMEVFLVLLGVIFVGIIASVVTSALSHLTYKAAELKQDSDLTI